MVHKMNIATIVRIRITYSVMLIIVIVKKRFGHYLSVSAKVWQKIRLHHTQKGMIKALTKKAGLMIYVKV